VQVSLSIPSPATGASFDQFQVDLTSGELLRSGVRVPIQGHPFQVLRLLLEAEGKVVTREELRQVLWPEDTFVDFELGVNTAVKKLRQALEDSADHPKFIETLPNRVRVQRQGRPKYQCREAPPLPTEKFAPAHRRRRAKMDRQCRCPRFLRREEHSTRQPENSCDFHGVWVRRAVQSSAVTLRALYCCLSRRCIEAHAL